MSQPNPYPPPGRPGSGYRRWGRRSGIWSGVILVVVGALLLLNNLGLLAFRWDLFWPVLLIVLGIWLIARRIQRT